MSNPEYTEATVNAEIRRLASLPVSISWLDILGDGSGEDSYAVYLGDDRTPYYVDETSRGFEIYREKGPRSYQFAGSATTYEQLAEELVAEIEYALEEGYIEREDEE
jgi:hypothetical protein